MTPSEVAACWRRLEEALAVYRAATTDPIDLVMHECGVMVAVGENHVCLDHVLAHERVRLDAVGA